MQKRVSKIVDEIFKEANNGLVKIKDWKFFLRFYRSDKLESDISNSEYPLFHIYNYSAFIDTIVEYLKVAEEFYKENKDYYELYEDDFYKRLILDLLTGASSSDLYSIDKYIKNKTEMLKEEMKEETHKIGVYNDIDIYASLIKNKSNCESPYRMDIYFQKGDDRFYLPSINFGVVDSTCYLGSVQRKKNIEDNELSKKLDRYFRKVNKGVDSQDIISKITPSALVSLTIFNSLLVKQGMKDIKASSYMPIRYYGNMNKLEHKKDIDLTEAYNRLDSDQYNMTNKFMYLLLRYDYHFNTGVDYDDVNGEMILKLEGNEVKNDNIIYQIKDSVDKYNNKGCYKDGRIN